ncbi:type I restriction endonuclease subunit R [Thermostichus vulcanus]|uniref:Type I restriction enzyme endonuclease subunit n=1 Tax=Thermostichus vulcanus str. 'Rupite' TaxID=2813851 RepID=A0ABT0C6X7_THEVL|nr:type I restriction endonuclease subunit R [Thermostichus vulcanus]MCJ2541531.1 type I restriction endonuclease subunit R [Thermostichus vulcanus str. 'Rupite']
MSYLTEADIEQTLLEQLQHLGYTHLADVVTNPDGSHPERESYADVILSQRLRAALDRLNPTIPAAARDDAFKKIIATEKPNLIEENRRLHRALVEGIDVEFYAEDGTIRGDKVYAIDFANPSANDWLVLNQFTVIENGHNRRPDVVVFINGLPIAVIEIKSPSSATATLAAAYNQLQTYKTQIASLFRTNALLVTTDGLTARIGSLTADLERFMPWRTIDGSDIAPKGTPEMPVLIEGVFAKSRLLDLIQNFTVFGDSGSGICKIIAGYHQFHAVQKAVASTIIACTGEFETRPDRNRKAGVIWHTQGSGKSLLMAFYVGQLVRRPELENPTIVVITDRNDLDDQLFSTFAMCRDLIRQTPQQADSREDLQTLLNRASGGVVFTTIQKFAPTKGETTYPVLSDRRNVIVIADEAHRSQYGFKAKVDPKTGDIAYGFAKYLRDALPNASFIGFTGTPIEAADVNTPAVFGDYIDIYDISRAVEDGATVPIYYESRLARIDLPEDQKPQIDAEIEELFEDEEQSERAKLNQKWATVQALVGAEERLKLVAADLVSHFENRVAALKGKAMIVCMSRAICVKLYNQIVALRPDWHSPDDNEGTIKIVMTGSAADPQDWQPHIGTKARRDLLAKRVKDPNDPLQLVIVRDMWLTGFDAPSMHTIYIDKPMKGHSLMQAIARVNRVFRDKPAGLVVDYIGIAQRLKEALRDYSAQDQQQTGIDEREAIALMLEKYDVVRAMFHGFEYQRGLAGTPQERLVVMAEAIEWILEQQHQAAQQETDDNAKKQAHRRYQDAVLALSKAFALAAASDEARQIRDEVGFFQTIRAALGKGGFETNPYGKSAAEREFAVQQIIDRAVVSTEIVDILSAAGLSSPDISILSDDFLLEIQQMEKKNLALEALKRLLNDEIHSHSRTNVTEEKKFSERLEQAIARYHTNAISTVEVLQELINLAQDIKAARQRGEEQGLSAEEIAFYDALAENESAVKIMGNDSLKIIAHELLMSLKSNVTVDWAHRQSARARLRTIVKRILRRYGYPPDLQAAAVQNVLQQAEALSAAWVVGGSG